MIINEMVDVVSENYVSMFGGEAESQSVEREKIKNFIETLDRQGINVMTVSLPEFIVDDKKYKVKTYKIDEDHPFKLESNVDTIFLYQWFKYPIMGFEVIRFTTKSKEI